jgi:hypothetical protein
MIQPLLPPVRSVPRGNAENGGKELMPRAAFSIVARFVCLKSSLTRPIDRTPKLQGTASTHRIPHPRKSTSLPRNAVRPRRRLCAAPLLKKRSSLSVRQAKLARSSR